jgi:hypothetical protein
MRRFRTFLYGVSTPVGEVAAKCRSQSDPHNLRHSLDPCATTAK